jgi:5-methylcytosine-specific restriction endonuclease McrA
MQKFKKKLKNIPTDASQVCSSINSGLNKDENLSDQSGLQNDKLFLNNPDENLRQYKADSDLRVQNIVYVLNMRGNPLMPTTQSKARRLLKQKKAKVVKRIPFTIQLIIATGETKHECTLGVDIGYKNIGLSVVSKKQELFSANVQLRTDISDKLSKRAMYRRNRRNKLWYRKPRWKNRVNAKQEGRLMPSVKQKINSHIRIIKKIKSILPISKLVIETGLFDMTKMKNPNIKNWQYQKGDLYNFENVKAFVLSRDQHTCYFKKGCSNKLHVHHIKFRSNGGSDNANNLITVCEKHHNQIHKGKLKLEKVGKFKKLKSATVMNVIQKRLLEYFQDAIETFGYETKVKSRELVLEKSHINDAFVIAGGTNQKRIKSFEIIQKRKNNRSLQLNRNGFKPSIRRKKYSIQPKDEVIIENKKYLVKGVFNKGNYVRVFDLMKNILNFRVDRIEKHFYQGSLVWN